MIRFHAIESAFDFKNRMATRRWLNTCIKNEGRKPGEINIIFCDDEYLLKINKEFLGKNDLTDIITFDFSENEKIISGDLYISFERVRANAKEFNVTFSEEICRVMVHGVLHLLGYGDKKKEEKQVMRQKEDDLLSLL
ncbi:MAG TPA: rRNA maturation RNase YbeY [Bacteroidales bacterium]|nr:rRNA maturation RNase YbeY [Bacteroidales bacterium]